ncbi:MAG: DUF349 domain-containing protein, partial [Muribaculaceae bacterium]|nr:DUF349 domain-containing protein [Muribaculaceae bacterium]
METRLPSTDASNKDMDQNLNQVPESGTCEKNQSELCVQPQDSVIKTSASTGSESESSADSAEEQKGLTKEAVIGMAQELASHDAAEIRREDVARLRKYFSDLRSAEIDSLRAAYEADATEGSAPFEAPSDPLEEQMRAILNDIKNKKQQWLIEQEATKAANLTAKQAIVEEINTLAADTDNVNRTYPRFQELRQKFLEAGEVTPSAETDLQRAFKDAQERYYDQLKVNKDLRDYDFRK